MARGASIDKPGANLARWLPTAWLTVVMAGPTANSAALDLVAVAADLAADGALLNLDFVMDRPVADSAASEVAASGLADSAHMECRQVDSAVADSVAVDSAEE
jgi:hypothetical protein